MPKSPCGKQPPIGILSTFYIYSPYGSMIILNADFSAPPAGTQPISDYLYQGMTLDAVTGLYYARNRNYSPSLGIWISQDPLQYVNGANRYQFEGGGPIEAVDSQGELLTQVGYPPVWTNVPRPGTGLQPAVTFPNNYVAGGGTFNVHLSPAGDRRSPWDTAVDVEFYPSKKAKCDCKEIRLIQFVQADYGPSGTTRGWHLDNGVVGTWWQRFWTSPSYYMGRYPWYQQQTPMQQKKSPFASAWDQPGPGGVTDLTGQSWKVYALCLGFNGTIHSLGYVSYGINYYNNSPSLVQDQQSYWIIGGGGSLGIPGYVPSLNAVGIKPSPGGVLP